MGAVIMAAHRFQKSENTNLNALFKLIEKIVHIPSYVDVEIHDALKAFMGHPQFPRHSLTESVIHECENLLAASSDPLRTDTIMVHSYLQFCKDYGWDPMRLSACKAVASSYNQYLPMRRALSIITLCIILSESQSGSGTY